MYIVSPTFVLLVYRVIPAVNVHRKSDICFAYRVTSAVNLHRKSEICFACRVTPTVDLYRKFDICFACRVTPDSYCIVSPSFLSFYFYCLISFSAQMHAKSFRHPLKLNVYFLHFCSYYN